MTRMLDIVKAILFLLWPCVIQRDADVADGAKCTCRMSHGCQDAAVSGLTFPYSFTISNLLAYVAREGFQRSLILYSHEHPAWFR